MNPKAAVARSEHVTGRLCCDRIVELESNCVSPTLGSPNYVALSLGLGV